MHASTAAPVSIHRLHRPLWQRCWLTLQEAVAGWQAQRRAQAEARALARLSAQTLRDIGMLGRVPQRDQRESLFDRSGGRW